MHDNSDEKKIIVLPPKYPVWDDNLKLFRPVKETIEPVMPCKKEYVVQTVELLQTDE